jgi:hypothetical protein
MFVWVDPHWRVSKNGVVHHVRGYWRAWPDTRSNTSVPLSNPPAA